MAIVNYQWRKDILKAMREHPDDWEDVVRLMHEQVPADLDQLIKSVQRQMQDNKRTQS